MSEKQRKILIGICFVLALIYGLYNLPDSDKNKKAGTSNGNGPEITSENIASAVHDIDIELYSSLDWGRDPFYRPADKKNAYTHAPVQPEWILNGILYDTISPAAVINKQIVRVGDSVDGAMIMNIEKQKVTLERNGSQFDLNISKDKS
jgi:hypothetical protein